MQPARPRCQFLRRRAGQQPLTREKVLATALALVDGAGLEALSMRRLGKELGVDPMAVYHHIPNEDELLRGLVQDVFSRMPAPLDTFLKGLGA